MEIAVERAWSGGRESGPLQLAFAPDEPLRVAPRHGAARGWLALPGFVDAHVHLELSDVRGEMLPRASFAMWIEAVIAARRGRSDDAVAAAVRSGALALLATGCVAIGDIDPTGQSRAALAASPLEGVVYREALGELDDARLAALAAALTAGPRAGRLTPLRDGLSPHAPWSTSEAHFRALLELAARHRLPVASHLDESADEERFWSGEGGLAELFARRRLARPAWSGAAPRSFARVAALAPPAGFVVIHGNRLERADLDRCARSGWPIVFCPRSRRYFGHAPPPIGAALAAGVTLALGTDSRASNDGLDLWREMEAFRADHTDVAAPAILAAATTAGRRALGLAPADLCAGDPATFQLVLRRDGARGGDLAELAVAGALETRAVFIRGRLAFGDPDEVAAGGAR